MLHLEQRFTNLDLIYILQLLDPFKYFQYDEYPNLDMLKAFKKTSKTFTFKYHVNYIF